MTEPDASLEATLLRAWLRRGALACALWPLSLLFRLLTALRRAMYGLGLLKSTRLAVPVIVVGNIFIGGTGKTPLTIWLVQALRAAGWTPGVVSRGYGSKGGKNGAQVLPQLVAPGLDARAVGDEPLLIAEHGACPVMVGRDRAAAGLALLAARPDVDVIVCDDGLQHYALRRDLEIVLFDLRGVGNGWTLPAGPLREAPSRRRDYTVVNVGHSRQQLSSMQTAAIRGEAFTMQLSGRQARRLSDGAVRDLAEFADATDSAGEGAGTKKTLLAAAGIGNPERFFSMLRDAGLRCATLALPDHYDYRANPFMETNADFILITEKDAVKCRQIEGIKDDPRLWVVPVTAHIAPTLAEQIVEKLRGRKIT